MWRMEEFGNHMKGRFALTGWAGTGSLNGLLLQPESLCVFTVIFV
jgi:hypothetical protein